MMHSPQLSQCGLLRCNPKLQPSSSSSLPSKSLRPRSPEQLARIAFSSAARASTSGVEPNCGPQVDDPTSAQACSERNAVDWRKVSTAASVVAVVSFIVGYAEPAHAREAVWKPRRHHRHIGQRYSDTWAYEIIEDDEAKKELLRLERQRLEELRRQQAEEEAARMREEAELQRQRLSEMMEESRKEAARAGELPLSIKIGGYELFPIIFWSIILGSATWLSRTSMAERFFRKMQGKPSKGKWVYDRSLGGKKVWVEDTSSAGFGATSGGLIKDTDFDTLASVAAAGRAKVDAVDAPFQLPAWWDPQPVLYTSESTKASKQENAQKLLVLIEQGVNRGEDYQLKDIVRLRQLCKEGGVSVKPKTVGGRDGIYRAAVEGAVTAAMDPTADIDLGDANPARFVTAVAGDLGMSEERAVSFVTSAVLGKLRLRLVDAVTSLKDGNETDAVMALIKLAALMEALPVVQSGGKEVELIASSLKATSSVEERKNIFALFNELYEDGASLVAEMLGFDPNLVMKRDV